MTAKTDKKFLLRITPELKARMKAAADREGMSMTRFINEAIDFVLGGHDYRVGDFLLFDQPEAAPVTAPPPQERHIPPPPAVRGEEGATGAAATRAVTQAPLTHPPAIPPPPRRY